MILTKKGFLVIGFFVAMGLLMVLWGIQKYRKDTLSEERTPTQSLQAQERVKREYIPVKLNEKGSDELSTIGANLW